MVVIRATIIEKYIPDGIEKKDLEIVETTVRFFSTRDKFHQWFNSFKDKLWEYDPDKVEVIQGIYVKVEEVEVDDMSPPENLGLFAKFNKELSYKYAS